MNLDIVNSLPVVLRSNSLIINVEKGQRLFRKGDRADYLYVIQRGRFQEVSYPLTGETAVLQNLNAGDIIGETGLSGNVYLSTVIAKTNSQIIAYSKSILLATLSQSTVLIEMILEILVQKICELQTRLEWRNISIADRRVLEYLKHELDKVVPNNDNALTLKLDTPLQEIAAELGFVPSTLSRALAKLESEQKIIRDRNYITLIDTDAA